MSRFLLIVFGVPVLLVVVAALLIPVLIDEERLLDMAATTLKKETGAVLNDISVTVEPGESLAIVGHSGGGKSTLVSLLPRFYDVDSGEILLDDTPIRDYTLSSLRNNISLVSQDVVLFNDSILNNLAYGELKKHSHEELLQAAEAAHVLG